MKKLHRILIVAACVLPVASMASPAFATMQILYRGTRDGYALVGSGQIDGNVATGAFQATCTNELATTIAPEACECKVIMIVYDSTGLPYERVEGDKGNLGTGVSFDTNGEIVIKKVDFYYYFNSVTNGPYTLYA